MSSKSIDIVKDYYRNFPATDLVAPSSSADLEEEPSTSYQTMTTADDVVVREYPPTSIGADGIFNLKVSYDGSWQTRGHTSNVGICAVIESFTGLVIDTHAMSNFCQECSTTGEFQKKYNPTRYPKWLEEHKKTGCDKNHEGNFIVFLL